ncbi:hypothetical protein R1sor_027364 [Riccia sorocarpa]|uniref:Uncharacterized protein n=1 Tax=Riccia sorocarpa TaxID=122646 RepID=A0ABD3GFN7_9MARC
MLDESEDAVEDSQTSGTEIAALLHTPQEQGQQIPGTSIERIPQEKGELPNPSAALPTAGTTDRNPQVLKHGLSRHTERAKEFPTRDEVNSAGREESVQRLGSDEAEGLQNAGGKCLEFKAAQPSRSRVAVGENQRRTSSWKRLGGRNSHDQEGPPNAEVVGEYEWESNGEEINLAKENLPEASLAVLPGGNSNNKTKPPDIQWQDGVPESKGQSRPAE